MSEEDMKDCSIKLFGQTIGLVSPVKVLADITVAPQRQSSSVDSTSQHTKYVSTAESKRKRHGHESINTTESPASSSGSLSEKTPNEDEPIESPSSQENSTLKKPDKLLPCPRCKSPNTKFCYYNNYNVKQPRHFCKNCQRYWTSGGTMRGVPIGSGRRKRKDAFAPDYRQISVLEAQANPTSGFLVFGPNVFHDHSGQAMESSGFPFVFYPAASTSRTLRISDPSEAAKSSIWSTLGIKKEKIGPANKTCLFEALGTKGNRNQGIDNTTIVLQANPAAFSRSLNFHETLDRNQDVFVDYISANVN